MCECYGAFHFPWKLEFRYMNYQAFKLTTFQLKVESVRMDVSAVVASAISPSATWYFACEGTKTTCTGRRCTVLSAQCFNDTKKKIKWLISVEMQSFHSEKGAAEIKNLGLLRFL